MVKKSTIEIIAEIGKNFVTTKDEESIETLLQRAKVLINVAKESDCDTVKFQVHNYEDEIHPDARLLSPHFNEDRYTWIKRNTYSVEFWWAIKEYCRETDINFLATPMSRGAAILLNEDIGVDRWKIGSGDILDFVMLDYIRDSNKPIILSSGMHSREELKIAYEFIREKAMDVSVLHCVSIYPCQLNSVNLGTISFLKSEFPKARIGFSDHSLDIEASLMAVQLGAEIIEKHFTLDRNAWGPDHKVSLQPEEMTRLVYRIRNEKLMWPTEKALGIKTKYIQQEEMQFRPIFQKGIYASRDLEQNELIEPDMLYALRPKFPGAVSSEYYPYIIGNWVVQNTPKYGIVERYYGNGGGGENL